MKRLAPEDASGKGLSLHLCVGLFLAVFAVLATSSQLCFSFSQELVFVLLAGNTVRAKVRAEKAGKVDEDHDIQQEQDAQQKGSQGPLASITQEVMGKVGLRGQAEEKVHDQVDIFVHPIEEEILGIVDLHHHSYSEEDVADLHQQC